MGAGLASGARDFRDKLTRGWYPRYPRLAKSFRGRLRTYFYSNRPRLSPKIVPKSTIINEKNILIL